MLIRYTGDASPDLTQLGLLCNTGEAGLFSNVAENCSNGARVLDVEVAQHDGVALICGGGPSLADTLESIREMKAEGAKVFALNNAAKFLAEHGVESDYQVIIDPRPENAAFVDKRWATVALLCSQCHPSVFKSAQEAGYDVLMWHAAIPGIKAHLPANELGPEVAPLCVSATLTVGLSVLSLVHTLGFREMHLYGYDSSHREDKSHAYRQAMNDQDEIVRCCVPPGEIFYSSMAMAGQANDFKHVTDMLKAHGTKIEVHGTGLIPFMWKQWQAEARERVLTAVYDLGVSPPSYDFLSFLVEAERYRQEFSYTAIDVVFQPGPMRGFRDDDLPPDAATRDGMLWRVCVPMAKLLPSVRNVEVLAKRRAVKGDVFPAGWEEKKPVAHYATAFLKNGFAALRSSELARRRVAKRYTRPYATISLRQAPHWPTRNSNISEWIKVADWLRSQGVATVFIPDADGIVPDGYQSAEVAAWDLDVRAALYEGAVINLGVLNGPMSLCAYLDCRYLIFNVVVEDAVASSTEFLRAHGYEEGDGFGGNGRLVWKPDTAENILPELKEFEVQQVKERTSNDA